MTYLNLLAQYAKTPDKFKKQFFKIALERAYHEGKKEGIGQSKEEFISNLDELEIRELIMDLEDKFKI